MINSAYHNGINFSGDFTRYSNLVKFDDQRKKNKLPRDIAMSTLLFPVTGISDDSITDAKIIAKSLGADVEISHTLITYSNSEALVFFSIPKDTLSLSPATYFEVQISWVIDEVTTTESIFSEIYEIVNFSDSISDIPVKITASNNTDRYGFLTNPAFGFFETVGLNKLFFINSKIEFKYSYSRNRILKSENNIGRRITFKNLTAYYQNLIRWFCNCENLYIDGIKYELISDFTELLNDDSSEIKDLRADFIMSEQSFSESGTNSRPLNVFPNSFFVK